jgi:hypothetical protein
MGCRSWYLIEEDTRDEKKESYLNEEEEPQEHGEDKD